MSSGLTARPRGRTSRRGCATAAVPRRTLVVRRAVALSALLLVLSCLLPSAASAHGISGRASLPVPAWLFAWAAAIVLVVSFVLLSTMWSRPRLQELRERRVCAWPRGISVNSG